MNENICGHDLRCARIVQWSCDKAAVYCKRQIIRLVFIFADWKNREN